MISVILLFGVLLFLPQIIDGLKIGAAILIEVLKFALIYGTLPAMFYLAVYLNSKGN